MEQISPFLALAIFAIVGPLFWCSICWLISRMGGWHRWAEFYPDPSGHQGRVLTWQSGAFRLGQYNGVLNLSADPDALVLSVILPFRFGHAPIRIPWEDLKVEIQKSRWFGDIVYVSAKRVSGVQLRLAGRTWKRLQETGGETVPSPSNAPPVR